MPGGRDVAFDAATCMRATVPRPPLAQMGRRSADRRADRPDFAGDGRREPLPWPRQGHSRSASDAGSSELSRQAEKSRPEPQAHGGQRPLERSAEPVPLEEHLAEMPTAPRPAERDRRVRLSEEITDGEGRPAATQFDPAVAEAVESGPPAPGESRRDLLSHHQRP